MVLRRLDSVWSRLVGTATKPLLSGPQTGRAILATMTFNHELAVELLDDRDRDTARFFAGRDEEIRRFDAAVREARRSRQAVFRIYQGAPGCGKTSLAEHLKEIRSTRMLFVGINPNHLRSADALMEQVRRAATESGSSTGKAAYRIAEMVGSRLRIGGAAKDFQDYVAKRSVKDAGVVLHLDEAHSIGPSEGDELRNLHMTGLGLPCVLLLTGLRHTLERLTAIEGLSGLSRNAVVDMGAMAKDECAESTGKMLEKLGVVGDSTQREQAARMAAELSYGWPQHLNCAQVALCRELLRVSGALDAMDAARVANVSDQMRYDYYRDRLAHPVLSLDPSVTKRIIVEVDRRSIRTIPQLNALCDEAVAQAGLADDPFFVEIPPGGFARTLLEKGVVTVTPQGGCELAIPSMVDWAVNELAADPQSASPTGRDGKASSTVS